MPVTLKHTHMPHIKCVCKTPTCKTYTHAHMPHIKYMYTCLQHKKTYTYAYLLHTKYTLTYLPYNKHTHMHTCHTQNIYTCMPATHKTYIHVWMPPIKHKHTPATQKTYTRATHKTYSCMNATHKIYTYGWMHIQNKYTFMAATHKNLVKGTSYPSRGLECGFQHPCLAAQNHCISIWSDIFFWTLQELPWCAHIHPGTHIK